MFKFLKDKLKSFFKKSGEIIEKSQEQPESHQEKKEEIRIEVKAAEKSEAQPAQKEEKQRESKPQLSEENPEKKPGFLSKLFRKFDAVRLNSESFERIWQELEILLIQSNVALGVVEAIKENLQNQLLEKEIDKKEIEQAIKNSLRNSLYNLMIEPFDIVDKIKSEIKEKGSPFIIMFFGINGTGKTTTIAKITNLLMKNGLSCVMAASDTFRAASIEQLEKHASKLNVKLIRHDYGADAAAVAYDAIQYAKSNSIDIVLVDTAGRMHTEANLMREMEKICKVIKPNLKIFIGESTVGNDMVEQAKSFSESIGLDSIILTKADVDEKGGAALSASYIAKKPVIFLGTGQSYEDLEKFDRNKLLERIGL